jgi:small subunit ribosomal protein S5
MTEGMVEKKFQERVLAVNRVAKKVKGGDKIGFTALVAVGDGRGRLGVGYGKARDLRTAIEKGKRQAHRKLISVLISGTTIPHRIEIKKGAAQVILKPAPPGSGLIAGGVIRDLLGLAGYQDVSSKILGTRNKMSNVRAVIEALKKLSNEAV